MNGIIKICRTTMLWRPDREYWKCFGILMLVPQLFAAHIVAIFLPMVIEFPGNPEMSVFTLFTIIWMGFTGFMLPVAAIVAGAPPERGVIHSSRVLVRMLLPWKSEYVLFFGLLDGSKSTRRR